MAEGSYGSPYYQQSLTARTSSPATVSKAAAGGVTRKKTRKWVEAKTINYDGSGWGDDDDDDEDDDEDDGPSPPPPVPSGYAAPRALPSQQSSLPSAALSRNAPQTHSSLHLQNERSHSPSASLPSQALRAQTFPSQSLPSQTLPSQGLPSQSLPSQSLPSQTLPSQQPWRQGSPAPSNRDSSPGIASPRSATASLRQDGRSDSPLGPRGQSPANSHRGQSPASTATPNGPRAFVRPSDIYKRAIGIDEPSPKKPVELPAQPVAPTPPPPAAPAPVELPATSAVPKHANTFPSSVSAPASAPIVETVIATGAKGADAGPTDTAVDANGERRFSSSPKLPDIARFSLFSPDLLTGFLSGGAPPVPSMPGLPEASMSTEETAKEAAPPAASQPKLASVAEDSTTAGSGNDASPDASKDTAGTDQSRATAKAGLSKQRHSEGPGAPAAASDPIAPLQARRSMLPPASLPLAPVGPRDVERARASSPASASSTNSPVKNSDLLREEIIRTLGTVPPESETITVTGKTTTTTTTTTNDGSLSAGPANTRGGPGAESTRTLTGDSSYLQNVYDDYWTPDGDDASGQEAYTPPPVPPLSTAKTGSTIMAAPAITASPELAATTPAELPSPDPIAVPSMTLSSAPSPLLSPAHAHTTRSGSAGPSGLRRQFSWEALQDSSPVAPTAPVANDAAAAVASAQSIPPLAASPAPSNAAAATPPVSDRKASIPAADDSSPEHEVKVSTSPPAKDESAGSDRSRTDSVASRPVAQAPLRSMLDFDDPPAAAAEKTEDKPTETAAAAAVVAAAATAGGAGAAATEDAADAADTADATDAANVPRLSGSGSTRSAGSAPSWKAGEAGDADAPTSAHSHQAGLGGANAAIYGSGNEGTAHFLTLRQCMAFSTHDERMAKLAETRREYALADSGLSGWLASMTVVPEYTRAAYAPLWDGPLTPTPAATSRPAAVAATIAHVPHVNISSSQISHKSKEIFGAAGKAGKGLLALRKKGFHKKSAQQ